MLYNERPLINPSARFFPRLSRFNTRMQRFLFQSYQVFFEFSDPYIQSIVKTDKEKVSFAIVIYEECMVYCFLIEHRLFLHLLKRPQRRIGHSHTNTFVTRIVHIKLSIHLVDFRSPKPGLTVNIFFVQGQMAFRSSRHFPMLQVCRYQGFNAIEGRSSIGIIKSIVIKDERIGKKHLFPFRSLRDRLRFSSIHSCKHAQNNITYKSHIFHDSYFIKST